MPLHLHVLLQEVLVAVGLVATLDRASVRLELQVHRPVMRVHVRLQRTRRVKLARSEQKNAAVGDGAPSS